MSSKIVSEVSETKQSSDEDVVNSLMKLKQLPDDASYIAHEEHYVKIWNSDTKNKRDLYSRMISKNKDKPEFIFMDGPPFVSGNLHPGHVAVGSEKSVIFIFMSMTGRLCVIKLGYDCHGLPAVNKTASENGLTTIESIKAIGLAKFNELCEKMIFKYSKSWTPLIQRLGRLADFENVYMTRDVNFMETCFWIFKQLWNKDLVYKGNKVMAYSYSNQTALSNFEASLDYKEKDTKSIYVGFELISLSEKKLDEQKDQGKEFLVAWTTTPWTLPANLALCVNKELTYVKIKVDTDPNIYVIGKNCINNLYSKKSKIEILSELKGSELVGCRYKPMYPFMSRLELETKEDSKFHTILSDSYVTEGDVGTAIVHLAPAFGEDDFRVCSANGLVNNINVAKFCPLDEGGLYTDVVDTYKGRLVFECEDDIRLELKSKGVLFKTHLYKHNYPYCWRSETPLIYRTVDSWYIKASAMKDRMVELIETVNITPVEIKNRFKQWLLNAKDWSISRSTSYATPIPLWVAEDGSDIICVGSIDELAELSGIRVTNLHPEFVNDIVIEKDNKKYRRIMDTFDCWYESGAVPMGQVHYPFTEESKIIETREYLSDFICEGMDQTRGWFYTLLVLSTAIFNKAPYRNVVCTGMILDKKGRKFSKRLGNFVDPLDAIEEFGADMIRVYFINSPVMNAECLKYNEESIAHLKTRFTPYINGVKFWIEHTINYVKKKNLEENLDIQEINYDSLKNLMDRWIYMRTDRLISSVRKSMETFKFGVAIDHLLDFIDDLTNWYIKFNRDRIKGLETDEDWSTSINVLYNVLMAYCQLWTPFTPFLSEHIYQHLRVCSTRFSKTDSVMLTDYPESSNIIDSFNTLQMFSDLQRVCSLTRTMRSSTPMHFRNVVPLKSCTVYHDDETYLETLKENIYVVQNELNCLALNFEKIQGNVTVRVETDRKAIGQFFRKDGPAVIKLIESQTEAFMMRVYNNTVTFSYTENGFNEILDQRFYKLYRVPMSSESPETKKGIVSHKNISSLIDKDLMVSIDHTYDEDVHNTSQHKKLFSAVQTIRKSRKPIAKDDSKETTIESKEKPTNTIDDSKEKQNYTHCESNDKEKTKQKPKQEYREGLGVRPWNKVTVILDVSYVGQLDEKYGIGFVRNKLFESLSNADVMVANFSEDELYGKLDGLHETDIHKLYGEPFEWELFDSDSGTPNRTTKPKTLTGRLVVHFKKTN